MLNKLNHYYVYVYLDPRKPGKYSYPGVKYTFDFEPFHIGKGSGSRSFFYIRESKANINKEEQFANCKQRCKDLLRQNLQPIIYKLEVGLEEYKAFELEENLISKIGRQKDGTGPLTNYHQGGKLRAHDFHSKEMRDRIKNNHWMNSENYSKEQHHAFGKARSAGTRKRISESKLGSKLDESTKKKISESCIKSVPRGKDHYSKARLSESHIENMRKARFIADQNRIREIFDLMKKADHTPQNNKFNRITYELARSKLFARMYPKFENVIRFFSEEEVKQYFNT